MEQNLELIIDDEPWNVILTNEDGKYFMVNTYTRTLYINNVDIQAAKYATWLQYHGRMEEWKNQANNGK
jgi:hypothetical protein